MSFASPKFPASNRVIRLRIIALTVMVKELIHLMYGDLPFALI